MQQNNPADKKFPPADTGNASNPSPSAMPHVENEVSPGNQAEKYLREGGNIEDMPDAAQLKEAEEQEDETAKE